MQTTAYTQFDDFAERLRMAVHTVLAESKNVRLGLVHRVGLRYMDVVLASGGKDFRFYLRPGLHGVGDEVFQPGQHLLHTESGGRTVVGGNPGTDGRPHRSEGPGVGATANKCQGIVGRIDEAALRLDEG